MRGVTRHGQVQGHDEHISTRTPHAGSDTAGTTTVTVLSLFQPALPMRGVTAARGIPATYDSFQPALPMRGVTRP